MKKDKKKMRQWLRTLLQLLFFIFFSSAFTAAFGGVKYIAAQLGAGERVDWTAFVAALAGLCGFTIIFGRFFCGFACAFGSLGGALYRICQWICKKCKKKPLRLSEKICRALSAVKYFVLAAIAVMCFVGVYPQMRGTSPWDVFSMLHGGNFRLEGYLPGVLLLALILVGMCVQERFFCRFLCPMGAVFSLLPALPFFAVRRSREGCRKGCAACARKCPSHLEIPWDGSYEPMGDCFQCQKCMDACPRENIHCGFKELRGNEIIWTLLRAGALCMVLLWMS
ncbi:MAG: 4Fe-4S binding protein [Lachnospiraceae bacterium]|nr:4Fe-4S binding protein [Lachnospiraceae bacterium]